MGVLRIGEGSIEGPGRDTGNVMCLSVTAVFEVHLQQCAWGTGEKSLMPATHTCTSPGLLLRTMWSGTPVLTHVDSLHERTEVRSYALYWQDTNAGGLGL